MSAEARMPTRAEYEARERRMLVKQLQDVERAPLAHRKEAAKEWAKDLQDPTLIAQRVSWLIDGCYGWGSYERAQSDCKAKRGNPVARLSLLIAALEWQCPVRPAARAFKKLQQWQQDVLTAAIQREIDSANKEASAEA